MIITSIRRPRFVGRLGGLGARRLFIHDVDVEEPNAATIGEKPTVGPVPGIIDAFGTTVSERQVVDQREVTLEDFSQVPVGQEPVPNEGHVTAINPEVVSGSSAGWWIAALAVVAIAGSVFVLRR